MYLKGFLTSQSTDTIITVTLSKKKDYHAFSGTALLGGKIDRSVP